MMQSQSALPLPGVRHGKRIIATVIEERAKKENDTPWVVHPIDDNDLSRGFQEVSFRQLNNAANHAAHWLKENLPDTSEPFQTFAYAGPKDLRWSILTVAAAKTQKVLILPSPLVTAEAQLRILEQKNCTVYLRPAVMAEQVHSILKNAPHVQVLDCPDLEEDDPWLVFNTSGTTGNPKPITYTHRMMADIDRIAGSPHIKQSMVHYATGNRLYCPLPALHITGMMLIMATTTYVNMTAVLGPPTPPTPENILATFTNTIVTAALLPPIHIDALCRSESGLAALRKLKFLMFAGAPLSAHSANLLTPHLPVICGVGSTECGGYFATMHEHEDAWDYLSFTKQAGARMEPRTSDGLHELVFVREEGANTDNDDEELAQVFLVYPSLTRFETKDLWRQHPVHKDLWKIVGRTDDYVVMSHGDGLHASSLEPEIEAHPAVKSALIGGHGKAKPVLVVELVPEVPREEFDVESLRPFVDRMNALCHEVVRLDMDRIIVGSEDRPFKRTIKGSAVRMQSLEMYKEEIDALGG
ncbi:AMP-binding enzyme [Aspergillus heterothallicus]